MAKGYTLEELQKMGAQPTATGGLTRDQLMQIGTQQSAPKLADKVWMSTFEKVATGAENIAGKVLGFTGGKKVAESLGAAIGTRPQSDIATPQEIAGDVVQVGATIATPVVGPAKSFIGALGKGTALTGTAALGKGLAEGKDIEESAQDAVVPALVGGGIFGLGYGIGKLAGYVTKQAPERLYQSALRQSTQDLKGEITKKAPNLSKQLIEKGLTGSENKIYSEALSGLETTERNIEKIINSKVGEETIPTQKIVDSLDEITRRASNVFGPDGVNAIDSVKQGLITKGQTITLKDALQLKRDIYGELSRSAFNVDASLSQKSEALRVVANSLKESIANMSDDLASLTKDQQMWLRASHAIEGKLAASRKLNIIGLSDTILSGASAAGGNVAGLLGGLGRRVFETTGVKTNIAVLLDRLSGLKTNSLGLVSKEAVINLLKDFNQ